MNYKNLITEIENLKSLKNVSWFVCGFSTLNEPIYCFHIGIKSGKQVFMEGGIHAREYLSTLFLIEEVKYLSTKNLDGGFYVVPLVNPDGVRLVLDGYDFVKCKKHKEFLKIINDGNDNFSLWKANILGVDLNVNFNAEWGKGAQNKFCYASESFVGFYAESEREVQTLISLAKILKPNISLSWHTKGEVIYYGFYKLNKNEIERDFNIAKELYKINGYKVLSTGQSVGGFSDWAGINLKIPALTIELGNNNLSHPLTENSLTEVFEKNKDIPIKTLILI